MSKLHSVDFPIATVVMFLFHVKTLYFLLSLFYVALHSCLHILFLSFQYPCAAAAHFPTVGQMLDYLVLESILLMAGT